MSFIKCLQYTIGYPVLDFKNELDELIQEISCGNEKVASFLTKSINFCIFGILLSIFAIMIILATLSLVQEYSSYSFKILDWLQVPR